MAQLWGGRFTKETDKLVYIIRLEYNLFYLRDLQVSLRGKEEEKKKWR